MVLRNLLYKGIGDTIVQVTATISVRLGLVVSVLLLAPFVGLEEVGRFDLFVIGATVMQLAVTLGMDSGLAIVSRRASYRMRRWFLLVALIVLCLLTALWFILLELFLLISGWFVEYAVLMRMAIAYGALLGATTLIFSWFRWQSQARVASLLLTIANIASFAFATLGFVLVGTISSFIYGLISGGIGGIALCLLYMNGSQGFSSTDFGKIVRRKLLVPIATELLPISIPYFVASVSLILRRLVDRGFFLGLGDPALIGAYAIVARSAETIAFSFGIPSVGFAPILISRYREDSVRLLGRLLYLLYCAASTLLILSGAFLVPIYFTEISHPAVNVVMPLMLPIIAGTLFLGETSIAGYGYVLARKPKLFTAFSITFIVIYASGVVILSALGLGVAALGWSFLISSFLFSTATVIWSEKLRSYGYQMPLILALKIASILIAAWPLLV